MGKIDESSNDFYYFVEETSKIDPNNFEYKKHHENGVDWLDFRADMHFFDVINRNTRGYLRKNVEEATFSPKNKDRMKRRGWYGEGDHPFQMYESLELTRKRVAKVLWTNRTHRQSDPIFTDEKVNYLIETCPATEVGRGLYNDILTGLIPAFSCRSAGELKVIQNKPIVWISTLYTYDHVDFAGFEGAHMTSDPKGRHASIITEEGGEGRNPVSIQIPCKDLIDDLVKNDRKIAAYTEAADGELGVAGLTSDGALHLVNDGLHIYAGMNKKSVALVKDFYRSFGGK